MKRSYKEIHKVSAYTAVASYTLAMFTIIFDFNENNIFTFSTYNIQFIISRNKRVDSEKSFINYTKHFLHKWSAENKNISGLIQIDGESISNIGIVAKVQDFKAETRSLDSNSYRVLDALRIPNIVFRSTDIVDSLDLINVSGNIFFSWH